jgi:hypothetical protein
MYCFLDAHLKKIAGYLPMREMAKMDKDRHRPMKTNNDLKLFHSESRFKLL